MEPDRFIPPRIAFFEETPTGVIVKYAYLVRIDGQPWAYADPMEVHKPPHEAKTIRLDPSRIVEETSTETGQPEFAYRGTL